MLSAEDGVHAVAYDAVVINVSSPLTLSISLAATNSTLSWNGGSPPYVLERTASLNPAAWVSLLRTNGLNVSLPITGASGYYRVQSQ